MAKEILTMDVVDRAPLKVIIEDAQFNESHKRKLSECCEISKTNLISLSQSHNDNSMKNDTSFDKIKKWYNTNFMHKLSPCNETGANVKSKNSKMDKRHSWHLNESSEM